MANELTGKQSGEKRGRTPEPEEIDENTEHPELVAQANAILFQTHQTMQAVRQVPALLANLESCLRRMRYTEPRTEQKFEDSNKTVESDRSNHSPKRGFGKY